MKVIRIDLVVSACYACITWAYFSYLPEPNLWVFGFIMLCAFAISLRSHKTGMDLGGGIMQKIMKDTLDDKGWEVVRKTK